MSDDLHVWRISHIAIENRPLSSSIYLFKTVILHNDVKLPEGILCRKLDIYCMPSVHGCCSSPVSKDIDHSNWTVVSACFLFWVVDLSHKVC